MRGRTLHPNEQTAVLKLLSTDMSVIKHKQPTKYTSRQSYSVNVHAQSLIKVWSVRTPFYRDLRIMLLSILPSLDNSGVPCYMYNNWTTTTTKCRLPPMDQENVFIYILNWCMAKGEGIGKAPSQQIIWGGRPHLLPLGHASVENVNENFFLIN